jgi:hypothetical protein
MHNKILIRVGFYLLLLFVLGVAIYPPVAYILAGCLLLIWVLDLVIFKDPDFMSMALFHPMMGLISFLVISWIFSKINGGGGGFVYLGFLSIFYFLVRGFVVSSEQRRMVLWTFTAGILLVSGIRLVGWWNDLGQANAPTIALEQPLLSFISFALCILVAFLSESRNVKEGLFVGLTFAPLILIGIISANRVICLISIVLLIALMLFTIRIRPIPQAALAVLLVLGVAGLSYAVDVYLTQAGIWQSVLMPFKAAISPERGIIGAGFFGGGIVASAIGLPPEYEGSFFSDLIMSSGPPAFLILTYILVERARESFLKRRKVTLPEEKSYHLTVILLIVAVFALNTYSLAFDFPGVVLLTWCILGIAEA